MRQPFSSNSGRPNNVDFNNACECSVTEIAEAERISKSYVSRILRLALLAPDLLEAILGGWADQQVMLERLERPPPVSWEEQRQTDVWCASGAGRMAR